MVMKKLIVFSVVFALVAGAAFAVDVGGNVIGTVNFLEGNNGKQANGDANPPEASGSFQRIRLEGSGGNDEGTFGGWLRIEGFNSSVISKADFTGNSWESDSRFFNAYGYAWWKPLDMLKLTIGGNPDGMYGKEGVTGWMFYQTTSDTTVVNPGNVWGGGYGPVTFRTAFYGGFGGDALHLTVSPVEMVDINIVVPYWRGPTEAQYVYKYVEAQVDLKMDFGNIALTYVGNENKYAFPTDFTDPNYDITSGASPGKLFAYFGLTSIENLGLDVGIGFPFPVTDKETYKGIGGKDYVATRVTPIAAGLGAKFTSGSFGIKARVVASFAGSTKVNFDGDAGKPDPDPFLLTADILPFFGVSDNLRVFFSAGLGITAEDKDSKGDKAADSTTAFHINPYVEVGQEWGPKFVAGFRLWGAKTGDADADINWGVPLALHVSF